MSAAWYGQPRALAARVVLRVPDGADNSTTATLSLWRAADGRTRLLLTRLDVDVLQVLISPDGSFNAWAPRANLQAQGDLAGNDLPPVLADLRLVIDEVCTGPVTPGLAAAQVSAEDLHEFSAPTATGSTRLRFADDGWQVVRKEFLSPEGTQRAELVYGPTRAFDAVRRPVSVEVRWSERYGVARAWVRSCDALPDISAERMRLAIPANTPLVPVAELLERLDS